MEFLQDPIIYDSAMDRIKLKKSIIAKLDKQNKRNTDHQEGILLCSFSEIVGSIVLILPERKREGIIQTLP